MIPSWAKSGQKVICVDAKPTRRLPTVGINYRVGLDGLTEGSEYTIRDMFYDEIDNIHVIRVHEITRKPDYFHSEPGYRISRFRPLITLEDDMKLFDHLKNPSLVGKLDLLAERMNDLASD